MEPSRNNYQPSTAFSDALEEAEQIRRFQRTQLKEASRARKDKEHSEELAKLRKTIADLNKKNESLLSKKPSLSQSEHPLPRPRTPTITYSAASGNSDDGDVWDPNQDLEEYDPFHPQMWSIPLNLERPPTPKALEQEPSPLEKKPIPLVATRQPATRLLDRPLQYWEELANSVKIITTGKERKCMGVSPTDGCKYQLKIHPQGLIRIQFGKEAFIPIRGTRG